MQHNRQGDKPLDPPLTIGDKYFLTARVSDQNIEAGRHKHKHSPSCPHTELSLPNEAADIKQCLVLTSDGMGGTRQGLCLHYITVLRLRRNENKSQYIRHRLACNLDT